MTFSSRCVTFSQYKRRDDASTCFHAEQDSNNAVKRLARRGPTFLTRVYGVQSVEQARGDLVRQIAVALSPAHGLYSRRTVALNMERPASRAIQSVTIA